MLDKHVICVCFLYNATEILPFVDVMELLRPDSPSFIDLQPVVLAKARAVNALRMWRCSNHISPTGITPPGVPCLI